METELHVWYSSMVRRIHIIFANLLGRQRPWRDPVPSIRRTTSCTTIATTSPTATYAVQLWDDPVKHRRWGNWIGPKKTPETG